MQVPYIIYVGVWNLRAPKTTSARQVDMWPIDFLYLLDFFEGEFLKEACQWQSGNDGRLRTTGSKIEGWNAATHAVESLILEKKLNAFDPKMLICGNL